MRTRPDLAAPIRVASEIYAGSLSPSDALRLGLAEGRPRDAALLDAAFRTDPGSMLHWDYF